MHVLWTTYTGIQLTDILGTMGSTLGPGGYFNSQTVQSLRSAAAGRRAVLP